MKFKLTKKSKEQLKEALDYNVLKVLDEDSIKIQSMIYTKAQEEDVTFIELVDFTYEQVVVETIKKAIEML